MQGQEDYEAMMNEPSPFPVRMVRPGNGGIHGQNLHNEWPFRGGNIGSLLDLIFLPWSKHVTLSLVIKATRTNLFNWHKIAGVYMLSSMMSPARRTCIHTQLCYLPHS